MSTRREILRAFAGAAAGFLLPRRMLSQIRPAPREAPNILFIMTDDQRQDALSVYGNPILRTPNVDRIGNEGVRFTEFFVTSSLCAPSRATFLTGLYSHAHGVITNGSSPASRVSGASSGSSRGGKADAAAAIAAICSGVVPQQPPSTLT